MGNRTTGWLNWAAQHEAAARECEKAGDWRGAAVERDSAREGLRRADEALAEDTTRRR